MHTFYEQPGFWLAVLAALLMYVNALRTLLDPMAFSRYMGLPIQDPLGAAWVRVYGLRALFIGLLATYFLVRRDAGALQWLTALAVPLALGDAWLVRATGGTTARRHVVIGVVLIAATFAIHRWSVAAA
jgi:hypothetical protein